MVSKTSNVIVSPSVVVVYLYFDSGRNKKKTGIKIPTGNNSVDTLINKICLVQSTVFVNGVARLFCKKRCSMAYK